MIWGILGPSVAIFGPVPVPGTGPINLSLFDLAVPALVLWGMVAGWLRKPSPRLVAGSLAAIGIVILHSGAVWATGTAANPAALVKETVKLTGVVVLFAMVRTLMACRHYQLPASTGIGFSFLLLVLAIVPLAPSELYQDFHAMLGATATGLGILWILALARDGRAPSWTALIPMACWAAALWLASKTYAVIGMAAVGACLCWPIVHRVCGRSTAAAILLSAILFGAAFGGFALMRDGISLPSPDNAPHAAVKTILPGVAITSVESSQTRRLDLWREGFDAGISRFPLGIGLGQFNTAVASGMTESYLRSTSTHNTPLTLFIEMGLAGLVLFALFGAVVWRAALGYPPLIAVMLFLLLGPSALLHDVLGMRILVLLIALGLARAAPGPEDRTIRGWQKSPS